MRNTLALLGLLLLSAAGASAQEPVKKPKPRCPCEVSGFTAKTEKATAVAEYWKVRRTYRFMSRVTAMYALTAIQSRERFAAEDGKRSFEQIQADYQAARRKAVGSGGLVIAGDDFDGTLEFKLEQGVDYVIAR